MTKDPAAPNYVFSHRLFWKIIPVRSSFVEVSQGLHITPKQKGLRSPFRSPQHSCPLNEPATGADTNVDAQTN